MHLNYPSVIIPILFDNTSASSIECVVKTTALSYLQLYNISHIPLLFSGSRPVVGSSKKITDGYPTNEIAKLTRLFMPPDN